MKSSSVEVFNPSSDVAVPERAKCSPVVRALAYGAMGRRIDASWWTHSAISRSRQCSTSVVTKALLCDILSM